MYYSEAGINRHSGRGGNLATSNTANEYIVLNFLYEEFYLDKCQPCKLSEVGSARPGRRFDQQSRDKFLRRRRNVRVASKRHPPRTDVQVFVKLSLLSSRVTSMRSSYQRLSPSSIQITSSLLISFLMDDYFLFDVIALSPRLSRIIFSRVSRRSISCKTSVNVSSAIKILSLSLVFSSHFANFSYHDSTMFKNCLKNCFENKSFYMIIIKKWQNFT